MARNERTPRPSRGARGSKGAQLGGIEQGEDTGQPALPQDQGRKAPRLALRAIHNRAGHFLGLEVVHV